MLRWLRTRMSTLPAASAVCASCALQLIGIDPDNPICPHHHMSGFPENWAARNRIWCDFFHRGRIPARVIDPPEPDFFEAYSGMTATGADPGV